MKKTVFAGFILICWLSGFCQPDEKLQYRKVSGFHGVKVSGGIDLFLSDGSELVAVGALTESLRSHIITEVVNGILRIHMEKNWHQGGGNPKMRAYVSLSGLKRLGASGVCDITLQNQIIARDLLIDLSGGSNFKGKLIANHLMINLSGGSGWIFQAAC